jgi:hypothetical protein
MNWPVSSHRLHQRAICLSTSDAGEVSTLLPFFDGAGQIQRVMVVSPSRRELRFFAAAEADLRIPWWGPIEISPSFPVLRVLEYEDLEELARLWHFDPWRQLAARGYQGGPRAQWLRQTNSAGRFLLPKFDVEKVYYSRDLTRVVWLLCAKTAQKNTKTWKRFRPEFLPPIQEAAPQPPLDERAGWQLAPFWSRENGAQSPAPL